MTEIIEDIKQEGITSAYIEAPFDGAQEALESENYFIISLAIYITFSKINFMLI